MTMQHGMMEHMGDHMQAGAESMAMCPMMKEMGAAGGSARGPTPARYQNTYRLKTDTGCRRRWRSAGLTRLQR